MKNEQKIVKSTNFRESSSRTRNRQKYANFRRRLQEKYNTDPLAFFHDTRYMSLSSESTFKSFWSFHMHGGTPHIFFSKDFWLHKFLRPFIFFLRKQCAKQIDNKRFFTGGGHYDPSLDLQGLTLSLIEDFAFWTSQNLYPPTRFLHGIYLNCFRKIWRIQRHMMVRKILRGS